MKMLTNDRVQFEKYHVDDFIDDLDTDQYASWFFFLNRQPASVQIKFQSKINKLKLFCTYKEKRYRVIMVSRMGDIGLTTNKNSIGYEIRVNPFDCSDWSDR